MPRNSISRRRNVSPPADAHLTGALLRAGIRARPAVAYGQLVHGAAYAAIIRGVTVTAAKMCVARGSAWLCQDVFDGTDLPPEAADLGYKFAWALGQLGESRLSLAEEDVSVAGLSLCEPIVPAGPDEEACDKCGGSAEGINGGADVCAVGPGGRPETQTWCAECRAAFAVACDRCGDVDLEPDAGGQVSGSLWCRDCVENYTATCERCGDLVDCEDTREVDGDTWCDSCADNHAYSCVRCGEVHSDDSDGDAAHVEVDGERWCRGCAEDYAYLCDGCGGWTQSPNTDEDDVDRILCDDCHARRERDTAGACVYGYHGFSGRTRYYGGESGDAGTLFLGFELEAGATTGSGRRTAALALKKTDPQLHRFHLEEDGSIPDYGFELISMPHTLAEHEKYDWSEVLGIMRENGLKSHDIKEARCGLHIHVSRAFLSEVDCAKLDIFVNRNRKSWEKLARRTESSYAQFKRPGPGGELPIKACGKGDDRYSAVNFRPTRTVEFRLFRGTLKYETLMATLGLADAACRWIKSRSCVQLLRNETPEGSSAEGLGEMAGFVRWMGASEPHMRAAKYARACLGIPEPVKKARPKPPVKAAGQTGGSDGEEAPIVSGAAQAGRQAGAAESAAVAEVAEGAERGGEYLGDCSPS